MSQLAVLATIAILLAEPPQNTPSGRDSGSETAPPPAATQPTWRLNKDPGPLRSVSSVDLDRYMGRWYEIARYENRHQKGMVAVIAEYEKRKDGKIKVVNSGRNGSLSGSESRSEAVAWSNCTATNARLYVRFIWPFRADYWIIDLCPNYTYAVVGQPCRTHLWILSRTPQMPSETYDAICHRLAEQGYDPARLQRTQQQPEPK